MDKNIQLTTKAMKTVDKINLIQRLQDEVKLMKKHKIPMNQRSWGYEEGCLISGNDALDIIKILKEKP